MKNERTLQRYRQYVIDQLKLDGYSDRDKRNARMVAKTLNWVLRKDYHHPWGKDGRDTFRLGSLQQEESEAEAPVLDDGSEVRTHTST